MRATAARHGPDTWRVVADAANAMQEAAMIALFMFAISFPWV